MSRRENEKKRISICVPQLVTLTREYLFLSIHIYFALNLSMYRHKMRTLVSVFLCLLSYVHMYMKASHVFS